MNLKQLEAFVEVAEGGSFSKAAKNLFLTLSTQVKDQQTEVVNQPQPL